MGCFLQIVPTEMGVTNSHLKVMEVGVAASKVRLVPCDEKSPLH